MEVFDIRDMMETPDAHMFPKEDIINFVRLTQAETGIENDIMVDNSMSYIKYCHPLWVYVRLGINEFGIITVDNCPKVLIGDFDNVDIGRILGFLVANNELLHSFADKKILGRDFYKELVKKAIEMTDMAKV